MKESIYWLIGFIVIIAITTALIVYRGLLTTDPMFIELMATFLGVFAAIVLGEAIKISRKEITDERVLNDLIEELKDIIAISQHPADREQFSATWTLVKTNGFPTRIEPELQKALIEAFETFEIYNNSIRRREEYHCAPNPDEKQIAVLNHIIKDAKKRLHQAAQDVFEMA